MDRQSKTGAFLILTLALFALFIVFLIAREWRGEFRSDSFEKAIEVTRVNPQSSGIRGQGNEEKETDRIEWPTAFAIPEAQPFNSSGDLITNQLNDEGLALYAKGDYSTAIELFDQALKRDPANPVLRQNLAYAKGSLGWHLIGTEQYHDALLSFQDALNLFPPSSPPLHPSEGGLGDVESSSFYMGMGLIYYRLQDEVRAIEMLKEAIARRPEYAEPYKLLGEIFSARDEMDLAVGYLEKAAELDSMDLSLHTRLAKAHRERNAQGSFQQQATRHFTVKFEGREEREVATHIIDFLEEAYREIGQALSFFPHTPITVILYSNQQFRDVTLTPSWSQGLFDGKIRLPIEGSGENPALLQKVVFHEYTHAVVYEISKGRVPTWLNEGIALSLEGKTNMGWEEVLLNRLRQGHPLFPLTQLHGTFMSLSGDQAVQAYAQSYSATQYLINRYGLYRVRELISSLSDQPNFQTAFENQFFIPYAEYERGWSRQIESRAHEGT